MSLLGYLVQTYRDFEVVVADDGSDQQVAAVLDDPVFSPLTIRHVWQPDQGFRANTARNRAISRTSAGYLIFADSDCIPRNDFVASHLRHRRKGHFISGGRVHVGPDVFQQFSDDDILSNLVFDPEFLAGLDTTLRRQGLRLVRDRWYVPLLNALTWRYCVFHGSNASAWRSDLIRVNGFDEGEIRGYGSDDRDIGVRLRNSGVRSRFLKFSLVQLHLQHPRPYLDRQLVRANRRLLMKRFFSRTVRAPLGLDTVAMRP
jgi:glycosyltransferase involved in cell wall biosynthesis